MTCNPKPREHEGSHDAAVQRPFAYNPYEVAFCGQAGSSRSTLVSRLVRLAFTEHIVAHVDNDVPYQSRQPEETYVYCENTRFQHVVVYPAKKEEYVRPWPFLDADFVLVEEGRDVDIPKIVVLDDLKKGRFSHVIGYVGRGISCAGQATGAPYFDRDNLDEIRDFILGYFQERISRTPLHGLVLAGGQSRRMNRDKASLDYHGKPQVRHTYDLLSSLCDKVYVSNRPSQASDPVQSDLPQIHDRFVGMGPMGGILSALQTHPEAAWLVVACDMPFLDEPSLEHLVARRNPYKFATSYTSPRDGLPEPLCAIYEPKSVFRLLHFLGMGYRCPRKVLVNSDTCRVEPLNPYALTNVNNPAEYEDALAHLRGERRAAP